MTSATRAASERQFYVVLKNVAEALLQLSDGDLADAEGMLRTALRRLEEFLPRFRGLNIAALRRGPAAARGRDPRHARGPEGGPRPDAPPPPARPARVKRALRPRRLRPRRHARRLQRRPRRGVNAMLARVAPGTPAAPGGRWCARSSAAARATSWRAALAHAGLPTPPEDALPVFLEEYAARLTRDHTRFYPGVEDALARLSACTLAVLTNKPGDMSRAHPRGAGGGGPLLPRLRGRRLARRGSRTRPGSSA